MRSPVSFLLCLSAALLAGCADPPPQPEKPDPQKTEVDPESNTFTITDSTEQAGPEDDALASLKAHLERVALDLMVKEVLGDDEEYRRNNEKVFDLFLEHAREFVEASELANKRRLSPASKRLYATFRIRISREKVTKKLQREGILVSQQGKMRVLLVVRSPAEGAQSSPLAQAYLDDLAESLSAELLKRGFQTKLWRDIRASLADSKRGAPASTARLLEGYVTGEDWKRPKDERYELPLLLLRSEGRLLVGFRIERLERRETGYELLARADAYDLLQGEALGYETESGRAEIGDRSLALARQALVTEVAQRLVRRFADRLLAFFEEQRRVSRKAPTYTFTFRGYDERELARIETLLAGVVAEDVESRNDGAMLVVTARIAREPIPVRDEISRNLAALGLASRPARRDGTTMAFERERER